MKYILSIGIILGILLLIIGFATGNPIGSSTETVVQPVRNFESVEELRGWLDAGGIAHPYGWDCVDYAIDLQHKALEDGYIVNFTVSENYFYNWFFTKFELADGTHAYNSVIIGDKLYYIEPMNHEISRTGAFLD